MCNKPQCICILLFFVVMACNTGDPGSQSKCSNEYGVIYHRQKKLFYEPERQGIKDTILNDRGVNGGEIGGEYTFYKSGKLSQYKFFKSSGTYTYAEYFNEGGIFSFSEGDPILTTNVDEVSSDSVKFNFYVFNLNKMIISFSVKIFNLPWITLTGTGDTLFSNVTRFEHPFNAKGDRSIKIYEKMEYYDCNGEYKKAYDSLYIERR